MFSVRTTGNKKELEPPHFLVSPDYRALGCISIASMCTMPEGILLLNRHFPQHTVKL